MAGGGAISPLKNGRLSPVRNPVSTHMAKWLMLAGAAILLLGAVLQFAPGLVNWFGRLPGDIRIETGSTRVFIPITSMIILSLALTLLVNLFRR